MSTIEIPDAETIVGQHWPLHGPYSDERTRAAGATYAELVRYLNYATGQGATTAIPWANSIESVVASLHAAACNLDQTLRQLVERIKVIEDDPNLYDYTNRDNHAAAVAHAESAAMNISDAGIALDTFAALMRAASSHLNYLGHDSEVS